MLEFDYSLNYKRIKFKPNDSRYRIGRGEQGVLLIRPYTNDICKYWRFKTPMEAYLSASRILFLYHQYKEQDDFVGMDMARKFLEMGFTRSRRYANHKDGKKYDENRQIKPQEKDWATSDKAKSAKIFKDARRRVVDDPKYIHMRKQWRQQENAHI
mgnify:FL=1